MKNKKIKVKRLQRIRTVTIGTLSNKTQCSKWMANMYLTHCLIVQEEMHELYHKYASCQNVYTFKKLGPKEENPQLSVKLSYSDGFIFWIAEI